MKWRHERPREKVPANLVEGYDPLALPAPQEFTCEILRVPSTYFSPVILTDVNAKIPFPSLLHLPPALLRSSLNLISSYPKVAIILHNTTWQETGL